MSDLLQLQLAYQHITNAIMALEYIDDEMIFESFRSEYETLTDIRTDLVNLINDVNRGEFDED